MTDTSAEKTILQEPENTPRKPNIKDYKILVSPEFHLKDKDGRQAYLVNIINDFKNNTPDFIAIEKIRGKNNHLVVKAFIRKTDEEIAKESGETK